MQFDTDPTLIFVGVGILSALYQMICYCIALLIPRTENNSVSSDLNNIYFLNQVDVSV